jgi:hypothetical protein
MYVGLWQILTDGRLVVFLEKNSCPGKNQQPENRMEKKKSPPSQGLTGTPVRSIVAIRGERGSYNSFTTICVCRGIVAIRGERGSYNPAPARAAALSDCSYPG